MRQFVANISFSRKFALIGALALILTAVPTVLLFSTLARHLASTEAERAAIAPIGAVLTLVQLTQQHRGQTAGFLSGQAPADAARQAKQAEVDAAWARAQDALGSLAQADLQAQAARSAGTWRALAQDVSARALSAPQSFARHTALVAQQLALLQAVANVSGIARHAELSGYYVQLAVVAQLPRLSETMGQLRARANASLVRRELGADERVRLESLIAQARQGSTDLAVVLAHARDVNPAGGKAFDTAAAAMFSSAERVLAQVETDIIKAPVPSLEPPVFWGVITGAIDQQFALSKLLFGLLDAELTGNRGQVMGQLLAVGAVLALLMAAGTWVLLHIARSVQQTLAHAVSLAGAVAAGDLTTPSQAYTRDELGQLMQSLAQMQSGLATVVGSVRRNADSVATASAQIAQGNFDLSSRTEEQAGALQQTAATMHDLGSTLRTNADHSRQADELARGAAAIAVKGGEMVDQVVHTMRGINDSGRQISEIISVINGIAFQTNILALNAAVEAARAGEQGRGFAVVASEVRTLAQRSAAAARQIKDLITTSVQRVEQGTALVDQTGHTMADIVQAIDRVKAIVGEISRASEKQSQGVAQVGHAVTEMDHATQRNASLVEESAAAAASLKEQAELLVSSVAAFKLAG